MIPVRLSQAELCSVLLPHALRRRRKERPYMAEYRYTAIIPTLNAAKTIEKQLEALLGQSLPPEEILVVDSQSEDGTPALAAAVPGVRVLRVARSEFDHGATRDMAIRASRTAFDMLLTQDALPVDGSWAAAMLGPFEDARVAAVCGRQIACPDARAYEREIRAFRYPASSATWGREDIPALGVRAYLLSDVCAAYRRDAYEAVGGFEHPIVTNEDMLIAADLLNAGYRLAYSAEAQVWHSHNHTLRQEYARNRRIGAFLARYGDRLGDAHETGEGLRMARAVSARLLKGGHFLEWVRFGAVCAAKLTGNRAGRRSAGRERR